MSFKYWIDYSQFTLIGNRHRMFSRSVAHLFFFSENADHKTPNDPKCFQLSRRLLANGKWQSRHPFKIVRAISILYKTLSCSFNSVIQFILIWQVDNNKFDSMTLHRRLRSTRWRKQKPPNGLAHVVRWTYAGQIGGFIFLIPDIACEK